jgi:hypothetical protein
MKPVACPYAPEIWFLVHLIVTDPISRFAAYLQPMSAIRKRTTVYQEMQWVAQPTLFRPCDVKVEFVDIRSFFRDTREAEFSFEGGVTTFLDEVVHKLNEHWQLRGSAEDPVCA